jgi:hypothetical protein
MLCEVRRIIVPRAGSATTGAEPKGSRFPWWPRCIAPRVCSYDGHEVVLPTWTRHGPENWTSHDEVRNLSHN